MATMMSYLLLFAITVTAFVLAALIINFAKRSTRRTSHGLTGMCHESGGTMCSSCTSQMTGKSNCSKMPGP